MEERYPEDEVLLNTSSLSCVLLLDDVLLYEPDVLVEEVLLPTLLLDEELLAEVLPLLEADLVPEEEDLLAGEEVELLLTELPVLELPDLELPGLFVVIFSITPHIT